MRKRLEVNSKKINRITPIKILLQAYFLKEGISTKVGECGK